MKKTVTKKEENAVELAAEKMYDYLINNGSTVYSGEADEDLLISHGVADVENGRIFAFTFMGIQSYENAKNKANLKRIREECEMTDVDHFGRSRY